MNRDWAVSVTAAVAFHGAVLLALPHVSPSPPPPEPPAEIIEVALVAAPRVDAAPGMPIPEAVPNAAPNEEPVAVPAPPVPLEEVPQTEEAPVEEPEVVDPPQPEPEQETVEAPEPPKPKPVVPKKKPAPEKKPKPAAKPQPQPAPENAETAPKPAGTPGAAPLGMPGGTGDAASASGDGSSPTPGLDATTREAPASVRAEPDYRRSPQPEYPLAARRRNQQGVVLLAVQVTAGGQAASVSVKKSSGFEALDEAAIEAVRKWEFHPAREGDTPVDSDIEVPVRFRLSR
ncbi:MAG: TonB family protein [Candidatus Hydrogenedens sp.]|nr:TonB family protein [Candidatus Hydrogenedens sp.]